MKANRHLSASLTLSMSLLMAAASPRSSALELLSENFDSGSGGFVQATSGTTPIPAIYSLATGTWSFPGDGSGPSNNTLTSPPITMPVTGGLRIRFDHRYNTEVLWEGVVLQLSINGGAYVTIPRTAFLQNGYTTKLIGYHELRGADGFNFLSPGYDTAAFVTSIAEFGAAAAGDTVRVRFDGAWDLNTIGPGMNWVLDRIVVETGPDGDGDGMADRFEASYGLANGSDDGTLDLDGDGLSNLEEFLRGTNPRHADTDDDGLDDAGELATDPLIPDFSGVIPGMLARFNFDSGNGGFTTEVGGTTPVNPAYNAGTGTWRFAGDGSGPSYAAVVSPPITMTATGALRLYFNHRYRLEHLLDGCVVEFSINGDTYQRVPLEAFSRNGYDTPIMVHFSDLFDEPAFTGISDGHGLGEFITSVADLGTARQGDMIRIRFLGLWDYAKLEANPNWEIADVALQLRRDADGDGITDDFEQKHGLLLTADDAALDPDTDGLTNLEESLRGTNPQVADTDGDGLDDGVESNSGWFVDTADTGTNPLAADTDGDSLSDGFEVSRTRSDPTLRDTDGDLFDDGYELAERTDPNNYEDSPSLSPDLEWSANRLPEGLLSTWSPVLNRINTSEAIWAFGRFGTVDSGQTNFRNVGAWVHRPGYFFYGFPGTSWQETFGAAVTRKNSSWEMVLRPGDYSGQHVLFNTGGNGAGVGLFLLDNILEFRFQNGNTDAQRVVVSTDLALLGPPTDFYHIVAVSDVNSAATGTGWLYVNGELVGGPVTSTGNISYWSDTDAAELGFGFSVPGSDAFRYDNFTGDIAAFAFYTGRLLDAGQATARYQKYAGVPTSLPLSSVTVDLLAASATVTWESNSVQSYEIEFSSDLAPESWQPLATGVVGSADATTTSFTHPFPGGELPAQMFFRVREEE